MTAVYNLCELNIGISTVFEDTHRHMEGYLASEEELKDGIAFFVETSEEDIGYEKEMSARTHRDEESPPVFSDGYLEELAVLRKISEKLPGYGAFLFHGSALCYDGGAYIFTAKSGVGKSTHAALWRKLLGDRVTMINDDKPFISIEDGTSFVHGNPYNGKHRLGCRMKAPLKALCLIKRGAENRIREAGVREMFPAVMLQAYRPADPEALSKTLSLLDCLVKSARLYVLECNMDIEAAVTSFTAMTCEITADIPGEITGDITDVPKGQ